MVIKFLSTENNFSIFTTPNNVNNRFIVMVVEREKVWYYHWKVNNFLHCFLFYFIFFLKINYPTSLWNIISAIFPQIVFFFFLLWSELLVWFLQLCCAEWIIFVTHQPTSKDSRCSLLPGLMLMRHHVLFFFFWSETPSCSLSLNTN